MTTWLSLKNLMLSERSEMQNILYCMIPSVLNVQKRQVFRDKKFIIDCLGWG